MTLEIIKNINVDFYDSKYIMVNAKQYDDCSRFISITCYNQGKPHYLDDDKHSAYVKYKKADGKSVLNICKINKRGEVFVELTEQMLAADGVCYVDLVVVNKGHAAINIDTGEIVAIDETPILSTMAFYVNVYEASVDNSVIESSDEYDGLVDLLQRAEAEYSKVVRASKSWAVGGTGIDGRSEIEDVDNSKYYSEMSRSYAIGDADNIRENENFDNAKYYSEQASDSADAAATSETAAKTSEGNARTSEVNAATSETNANTSETNAKISEDKALVSEQNAKISETNASNSETNAATSETAAKTSEGNARTSEVNAKASENNALTSANRAQSYAVGGTGTRGNEDYDNAHYYYELTKNIVVGLDSGFIPMGTVSFSELANVEKATGYVYNISDDFVTDESFREGAGKSYTAGTNVYYTANDIWDCFGGAASPTATVDEVKNYLGINDETEIV